MFGVRFVYFALAALLCAITNVAAISISHSLPSDISGNHQPAHPSHGNHATHAHVQDAVDYHREAHLLAETEHSDYAYVLFQIGKNHKEKGEHHRTNNRPLMAKLHCQKAEEIEDIGMKHLKAAANHRRAANGFLGPNAHDADASAHHAFKAHLSLRTAMESYNKIPKLLRQGMRREADHHFEFGNQALRTSGLHSEASLAYANIANRH